MQPRLLPKFPLLRTKEGGEAKTFDEKVATLRGVFFPPLPRADLSDVQEIVYLELI